PVHDVARGHDDAHNLHLRMTAMRAGSPQDTARANEVVTQLRGGLEKYKDYRVALNEGYKIFLPNLPQPEYHFTNYVNGFFEAFSFDASRPTSLLYKKTSDGYELVSAMDTMPKRATEEQLNALIPSRISMSQLHPTLCMTPKRKQFQRTDWHK